MSRHDKVDSLIGSLDPYKPLNVSSGYTKEQVENMERWLKSLNKPLNVSSGYTKEQVENMERRLKSLKTDATRYITTTSLPVVISNFQLFGHTWHVTEREERFEGDYGLHKTKLLRINAKTEGQLEVGAVPTGMSFEYDGIRWEIENFQMYPGMTHGSTWSLEGMTAPPVTMVTGPNQYELTARARIAVFQGPPPEVGPPPTKDDFDFLEELGKL